jgi:creatinine amidohydrolase/Fe(II)-dependent formamide hydrolase-like protein
MLALAPGLVQMDKINEVECEPKFRSNYLRKARLLTPTDWYAECDTQSYGNPKTASVELGNFLVDASVSNLVNAIRIVKEDALTNTLRAEYDALCKNPQP